MNPVFPAQKRAERFSSMLEDPSGVASSATDSSKHADLVPLVGLVTTLRSTPAPEARPEFVADLRSRLLLAAETALAPDTAAQVEARRQPAQRRTARERRLAVAVGGFALVSASASMSVAAQTALPGDTLYPLKRAIENVHETALRSPDDKGATMLDNASGRLDEVDELSRTDSQDADAIAQTLDDFADQAVAASGVLLDDFEETGRQSSLEELRTFAADSLEVLQQLESMVPVAARDSLDQAAAVLDEIERQATDLCRACPPLPALDEAVSTAADLGPLYEDIFDTATEVVAPVRPAQPVTPPRQEQPSTGGQQAPIDQPTEEPAPPAAPAQPTLPGDGGEGDVPAGGPRGGLETAVNGLGTLDLGDLLTGTTEAVDDLLGGTGLK